MEVSCYRFLEEIIDYAGLYPPAKLPMDQALQNYVKYRNDFDGFMIARFVCPANRLSEVSKVGQEILQQGEPFRFSVTGGLHATETEFIKSLNEEIAEINRFIKRHPERVQVEFYEAKFPQSIADNPSSENVSNFLNQVAGVFHQNLNFRIQPFFEAGFQNDWRARLMEIFKGIEAHKSFIRKKNWGNKYQIAGFKMRCGGETPQDYPDSEQIEFVLSQTLKYNIILKATAGLHHPIRHFNKEAGVYMHGFMNLFGASILANHLPFVDKFMQEIIEDEDPSHFKFDRDGFAWKSLLVPPEAIRSARKNRFISFGSCSFEEPLQDLKSLGYL